MLIEGEMRVIQCIFYVYHKFTFLTLDLSYTQQTLNLILMV